DARGARADPRVAAVLYRTALDGDRRVVVMTVLGALFVASLVERQSTSRTAWIWCATCVVLAGVRLLRNSPPRWFGKPAAPELVHRGRWLALLFVASAVWGAGPPLFLLDNPSADTLLTGVFLAAAGLSAPLLSAWRPAVYASLLPALVPLLMTLAVHTGSASQVSTNALLLTSVTAAFMLLLERLTIAQNNSLAPLLAVRFHNEDLVQQLRSQ